jgi:hypothetical protein
MHAKMMMTMMHANMMMTMMVLMHAFGYDV